MLGAVRCQRLEVGWAALISPPLLSALKGWASPVRALCDSKLQPGVPNCPQQGAPFCLLVSSKKGTVGLFQALFGLYKCVLTTPRILSLPILITLAKQQKEFFIFFSFSKANWTVSLKHPKSLNLKKKKEIIFDLIYINCTDTEARCTTAEVRAMHLKREGKTVYSKFCLLLKITTAAATRPAVTKATKLHYGCMLLCPTADSPVKGSIVCREQGMLQGLEQAVFNCSNFSLYLLFLLSCAAWRRCIFSKNAPSHQLQELP